MVYLWVLLMGLSSLLAVNEPRFVRFISSDSFLLLLDELEFMKRSLYCLNFEPEKKVPVGIFEKDEPYVLQYCNSNHRNVSRTVSFLNDFAVKPFCLSLSILSFN